MSEFGWIKDNENCREQKPMQVSDNLKYIGLKAAIEANPESGGKLSGTVLDVGKGVIETAETGLDVISFVGKNLKTIVLVLAVLVVAYFGFQFVGAAKTITRG